MPGRVAIVASETMADEASRLLVHAAIITVQPEGYFPTTLEVAYALARQLHVPRYNIHVTRFSHDFLTGFTFALKRVWALCKGSIDIGGSTLSIRPWRSAGGTTKTTWWFHVKVAMETVPLEAWNEEGVNLILGNECIFDRLDSHTTSRELSQLLGC